MAYFQFETLDGGKAVPYTSPALMVDGRLLHVAETPPFDPQYINREDYSLARYAPFVYPPDVAPLSLGEGWTPLIDTMIDGQQIFFKMEGANPTGSFKDRAAALMISLYARLGVERVHDDSSGNAAAALAGYAARAGIDATLFVPAYASPMKLGQISLFGAELETVEGPRSAATDAAFAHARDSDSHYASHAHHPFVPLANRSIAYELWEQLNHRAPDYVFVPLGHGTQIIGLYEGFRELARGGLIDTLPCLVGVQAAACAPLYAALHEQPPPDEGQTLAEGIRIVKPVRKAQVLEAIRETNGHIVTVSEEDIRQGVRALHQQGIGCEPTCAVVWPAYLRMQEDLPTGSQSVLSITGSGLKIANPSQFV